MFEPQCPLSMQKMLLYNINIFHFPRFQGESKLQKKKIQLEIFKLGDTVLKSPRGGLGGDNLA